MDTELFGRIIGGLLQEQSRKFEQLLELQQQQAREQTGAIMALMSPNRQNTADKLLDSVKPKLKEFGGGNPSGWLADLEELFQLRQINDAAARIGLAHYHLSALLKSAMPPVADESWQAWTQRLLQRCVGPAHAFSVRQKLLECHHSNFPDTPTYLTAFQRLIDQVPSLSGDDKIFFLLRGLPLQQADHLFNEITEGRLSTFDAVLNNILQNAELTPLQAQHTQFGVLNPDVEKEATRFRFRLAPTIQPQPLPKFGALEIGEVPPYKMDQPFEFSYLGRKPSGRPGNSESRGRKQVSRSQTPPSRTRSQMRTCYSCGKEGHWWTSCRFLNQQQINEINRLVEHKSMSPYQAVRAVKSNREPQPMQLNSLGGH